MKQQCYGRIVMTTSASGLYGTFGQSNYAAAKMGLLGLVNVLKLEGEKYNILVNAIAPVAHTPMTEKLIPENLMEKLKPEFVSPVAAFFSSEKCTVSGQCWSVGAGYVAKVGIMESKGHHFDIQQTFSIEDIQRHFSKIIHLDNASLFEHSRDQLPVMFGHD